MSLFEREGDLFDAPGDAALAHGCNCAGAMGKGIAVEFRRRWPAMYAAYRRRCLSGDFSPGDVFVWVAEDRVVYNLGTQRTWRTHATLDAVRSAATSMAADAQDRGVSSIALPRIGAGLGALAWSDVRSCLADIAATSDVSMTVYSLPSTG